MGTDWWWGRLCTRCQCIHLIKWKRPAFWQYQWTAETAAFSDQSEKIRSAGTLGDSYRRLYRKHADAECSWSTSLLSSAKGIVSGCRCRRCNRRQTRPQRDGSEWLWTGTIEWKHQGKWCTCCIYDAAGKSGNFDCPAQQSFCKRYFTKRWLQICRFRYSFQSRILSGSAASMAGYWY